MNNKQEQINESSIIPGVMSVTNQMENLGLKLYYTTLKFYHKIKDWIPNLKTKLSKTTIQFYNN